MAYNIPGLPFDIGADPLSQMRRRPRGGMRRQGPVDRLDESVGERLRGIPPELLQMLMAQFMGGQGGGARRRPPMGGGRPPMGGPQRGVRRPPMGGGGRPPVVKIEDLVRALSGGGGQRQAPRANMPVPQARR